MTTTVQNEGMIQVSYDFIIRIISIRLYQVMRIDTFRLTTTILNKGMDKGRYSSDIPLGIDL